jgi:hypothetical protein
MMTMSLFGPSLIYAQNILTSTVGASREISSCHKILPGQCTDDSFTDSIDSF